MKRLLLAIAAAFVITYSTDFLVHGLWLRPDYLAAQSLWRPAEEMRTFEHWVTLAQLIAVTTFVILWAKGFAGRGIVMGIVFGLLVGMSQHVWAIVNYVAMPVPGALAAKWFLAGVAEAVVLGIVTSLIYKPRGTSEP
ncbi:MAG TPA: hypothetical protein VGW39_10290 [Chthoniobacterales bacterium]|nr:hypothetical protein [Chthoniobacterales bacterium]